MVGRLTTTVLVAIALVSCGGGDQDDAASSDESDTATTEAPADGAATDDAATGDAATEVSDGGTATAAADEPPPAPASDQSCGDPATTIDLDTPVTGDVDAGESAYYCVEVPSGLPSLTVTLTELTDDLDLYVAYDTFDDLSGGLGLRFSDENGTDEESITVEPAAYRGELIGFDTYADVSPGPYWIEVAGQESSYALTVTSG